MINIDVMKFVKKELKKSDDVTIIHKANEEEQEYLKKYNIYTEIVMIEQSSIAHNGTFTYEYCRYYLKK